MCSHFCWLYILLLCPSCPGVKNAGFTCILVGGGPGTCTGLGNNGGGMGGCMLGDICGKKGGGQRKGLGDDWNLLGGASDGKSGGIGGGGGSCSNNDGIISEESKSLEESLERRGIPAENTLVWQMTVILELLLYSKWIAFTENVS